MSPLAVPPPPPPLRCRISPATARLPAERWSSVARSGAEPADDSAVAWALLAWEALATVGWISVRLAAAPARLIVRCYEGVSRRRCPTGQ